MTTNTRRSIQRHSSLRIGRAQVEGHSCLGNERSQANHFKIARGWAVTLFINENQNYHAACLPWPRSTPSFGAPTDMKQTNLSTHRRLQARDRDTHRHETNQPINPWTCSTPSLGPPTGMMQTNRSTQERVQPRASGHPAA